MQAGADYLIGEHDFTSFCNVATQSENHVRNIEKIIMKKHQLSDTFLVEEGVCYVILRITGNGFLYHMVRIIAGTLIQVGTGNRAPEEIAEILAKRDRRAAGPTAPPQGLTLIGYKLI